MSLSAPLLDAAILSAPRSGRQRVRLSRPPGSGGGFAKLVYRVGVAVIAALTGTLVFALLMAPGGQPNMGPAVLAFAICVAALVVTSEVLREQALEEHWELPKDGIIPVLGAGDPEVLNLYKNAEGIVVLRLRGPGYRAFESLCNLLLAGLALVFLAPLLLVIALLIRLDSPGPALIRSERIGRQGRPFQLHLFRTMHTRTAAYPGSGPLWSGQHDPRWTRAGRFLRRTSLDYLPMFLNVLLRDMNFVGPRPLTPEMAGQIRRVLGSAWLPTLIRPGVTGPSQLSETVYTIEALAALEIGYLTNQSVLADVRIILRSVAAVARVRSGVTS